MGYEKYLSRLEQKPEWGPLAGFVPNKRLPVYNWLYFKEGFARDGVFNLLDLFSPQGMVLDPYCGSGTTLLACKERGLDSLGIDQLPIALLASRVKTGKWDLETLRTVAKGLFDSPFKKTKEPCPFSRFFNKHALEDVLFFRREVFQLEEPERSFFLLSLVSSALKVSWLWKDGNVLKVKKHPFPPFRKFFKRTCRRWIKEVEGFKRSGKVSVEKGDPRSLPLEEGSVAGVITSPPYLNQIDYRKVYSLENWLIGEEQKMEVYLGLGAEKRYFKDLEQVLKELSRVCRPGARVGMVVGNAYFPEEDRIVESDLLLAEIGEKVGLTAETIFVLNKRAALQRRTIKRGELRESLITFKKEYHRRDETGVTSFSSHGPVT